MPAFIDLSGQRFGELVVAALAPHKIKNRPAWICRCDCGLSRTVAAEQLRNGDAKSCGKHKTLTFMASAGLAAGRVNRRYAAGFDSKSRIYTLWRALHWRCTDPSHEAFLRYGGRGIRVCEDWSTFAGFTAWARSSGYRDDLTLDRIDNDGHYEPANCRWATTAEQARNRRNNLRITAFGETRLVVDWAVDPRCAVGTRTLYKRLAAGLPPEFAITATEFAARSRAATLRAAARKTT